MPLTPQQVDEAIARIMAMSVILKAQKSSRQQLKAAPAKNTDSK